MMHADRALLVPQNPGAVNILVSYIVRVAFHEDVVTFGRARVQRICPAITRRTHSKVLQPMTFWHA